MMRVVAEPIARTRVDNDARIEETKDSEVPQLDAVNHVNAPLHQVRSCPEFWLLQKPDVIDVDPILQPRSYAKRAHLGSVTRRVQKNFPRLTGRHRAVSLMGLSDNVVGVLAADNVTPGIGPTQAFRQQQMMMLRRAPVARSAQRIRHIGTTVPSVCTHKLCEVGVDDIVDKTRTSLSLQLSNFSVLGLKLKQTILRADDPDVIDNPLRQHTSQQLANSGNRSVWVEVEGVLECGSRTGMSFTFPIGTTPLSLGVGFAPSALLCYRAVRPVALGCSRLSETLKHNHTVLPLSVPSALSLLPGEEVMIAGQGRVAVAASLGVGVDAGVGPVSVGVGASIEAGAVVSGTIGLHVTRLKGAQVKVALTLVDEESVHLEANVEAGLETVSDLVSGPDWGDGFLPLAVEALTESPSETISEFMSELTNIHASVEAEIAQRHRHVASFVFDLNKPMAARAYRDAMMLLTRRAEALTKIPNSGITKASLDDTTTMLTAAGELSIFGLKVLLSNTLRQVQKGIFRNRDGDVSLFSRAVFQREYKSGSTAQTVMWENVTVKGERGIQEQFCHLKFHKDDFITTRDEVERFFSFAKALKIPGAEQYSWRLPSLNPIEAYFSSQDDTKVDVDIYISKQGLRQIDTANFVEAQRAYLQASGFFEPELHKLLKTLNDDDFSVALILLAQQISSKTCCGSGCLPLTMRVDTTGLDVEYAELTGERSLHDDARAFKGILANAQSFATSVSMLNTKAGRDSKSVGRNIRNFWQRFARNGFDFMPTIAALAQLSGTDGLLVHYLGIQGAGLTFDVCDEGEINCEIADEIAQAL